MATPEEQQKFLENLQGGTNDVTGMTPEETDEAAGLVVSQGADATPAIDKSKIVTTTEPAPFGLGLFGIGIETDRDLYAAVNPFVTTPNVSVTEVMNFQDPEVYARFNSASMFFNAAGEPLDIDPESTIEDKIKKANQWGAVSYLDRDDDEIVIDWSSAVNNLIRIPEDIRTGVVRGEDGSIITTTDITNSDLERVRFATMMTSANLANPALGRPLYAAYLNNVLIRNGVDARGRFAILRDRLADPSMGDFENMVIGGTEAVGRSIIETGLWGVGEVIDWFDFKVGSRFKAGDFRGRQVIMDDIWPTLPQVLQNRYAQKGVMIDLSTAEDLAYTYTGLLPRAAKLAAEMLSLSKGSGAMKGMLAEGELGMFESWMAGELRKNPDMKLDDAIETWTRHRNEEISVFNPLRYRLGRKGNVVRERIATAYQIADSKLPPKYRAEIRQIRDRQAVLLTRQRNLMRQQRREGHNTDRDDEIKALRDEAVLNRYYMMEAERYSSVPKYMRDINYQDKYMVVGAATVGHFFGQEFEMVDPSIGELVGLGTGLVLSVTQGNVPRGLRLFNEAQARRAAGKPFTRGQQVTDEGAAQIRYLIQELSKAHPDFARQIEANAMRMTRAFDRLEARGVDRKFLNASIPIVTDLVTLRHLADAVRKELKEGATFNATVAEEFQNAHKALMDLNGELNELLGNMAPVGMADKTFFEFMRAMSRQGNELSKSIQNDLDIINKQGVRYYTDTMTANRNLIEPGSLPGLPDGVEATTFPEAVGNMVRMGLFDRDAIDMDATRDFAAGVTEGVNDSIETAAAQLAMKILEPEDLDRVSALKPSVGEDRAGMLHQSMSASTLFAFQLEAANQARKGVAMAPYEQLKDPRAVQFYDANNNPLSNNVTVNAFGILTEVFALRKSGLKKQGLPDATIDKAVVEISDPIFTELARVQGISVPQLLKDMKKGIEKLDDPREPPGTKFRFRPGRNVQAQLAEFLQVTGEADGFDARMFELDPQGLRNLDVLVRETASDFSQAGAGGVANALYKISDGSIESAFDNFTVDGVPVGSLKVEINGKGIIEFKTHLDEINTGWRLYKEDFHDPTGGAYVPSLLFNGRQSLVSPTGSFPTGIQTAKLPSQWLKVEELANPDFAAQYMKGIQGAMGRRVLDPTSGQVIPRLVEGDDFTRGQQSIIRLGFVEWMTAGLKNNTLTGEDIARAARDIEANVRMVDAEGNDAPLVNLMQALDDHTAHSKKTVGDAAYDLEMAAANAEMSRQLQLATEPARELQQGLQDASEVVARLTSDNIRAQDIASVLIDGGMEGYTQIRSNMLRLVDTTGRSKYKPEQVDEILRAAYINGMRRRLFAKTGTKRANVSQDENGVVTTTFSDMLAENPDGVLKFLGETPEEAEVARRILGNEHYETVEAIALVLKELTDNPLAGSPVQVTGMPRALSVESYISRIYAIQRRVVRPTYVGTEAVLQTLRFKNHEFLTALVTNPYLGREFLEIVRTGKPLAPERDAKFAEALLQHHALTSQAFAADQKEVVDPAGRKFTVSATSADKLAMGYPTDWDISTPMDGLAARSGSLTGPTGEGAMYGLGIRTPGIFDKRNVPGILDPIEPFTP